MSDMIEVVIDSIRVHLMAPQRVVVLKQVNIERYLTIWVGPYEAEAITVALQEIEKVRPLTHDLIKNIFGAFNARVTRVEIIKLQDDHLRFFGRIPGKSRDVNREKNGRDRQQSRPLPGPAADRRGQVPCGPSISLHSSFLSDYSSKSGQMQANFIKYHAI